MAKTSRSRESLARLVVLSGRLNRAVIELESIAASRDPRTGTFRKGGTLAPGKIRAAWSTVGRRAAPRSNFKTDLLNALRAPRV
jgi:hypothetical protein